MTTDRDITLESSLLSWLAKFRMHFTQTSVTILVDSGGIQLPELQDNHTIISSYDIEKNGGQYKRKDLEREKWYMCDCQI